MTAQQPRHATNEGAPAATVRPTAYAVSCVPEDHVDAWHFTMKVEYRGGGWWAATDGWRFFAVGTAPSRGYCWRDGSQEPSTDEDFAEIAVGREAWRALYWHDLDTALALAQEQAPLMTVNGHTVPEVLARIAAGGQS